MLRFEKATCQDAEVLAQVQERTFNDDGRQRGYGDIGPYGYNSVEYQVEMMETLEYHKIIREEQIIGGIFIKDMGEKHYELTRMFIDPEFQGQGIGSSAIKYVESVHPEVIKWSLDTPGDHSLNHKFYEKNGYVKIGESTPAKPGGFFLRFYEKPVK